MKYIKKCLFYCSRKKICFLHKSCWKPKLILLPFVFHVVYIHFGFNINQTRFTRVTVVLPKITLKRVTCIWFWTKKKHQPNKKPTLTNVKVNVWSKNKTSFYAFSTQQHKSACVRRIVKRIILYRFVFISLCKWQVMHFCVKVKDNTW